MAVIEFRVYMLSSFLVDEILLPSYVKLSSRFSGLITYMKVTKCHLKDPNSVLSDFAKKLTSLVIYCRLCSKDLARVDIFTSWSFFF